MGVYVSKTVTNDGRKYFFKCQYEVYDEDKPRTKVNKKFATAEEAAREERAFLDRVNDLKDCPVDMTFGELYESFRADRKKTVRYSTYRDYYYKHKYIKCFDKVKCYAKVKKFKNFRETFFVFGVNGGIEPFAPSTVRNKHKYNCMVAGLHHIRIHDFRHSCASLLINNSASVTMVTKFLGHTKVDVTLNTYSHMFQSALDEVINIINDLNNKRTSNYYSFFYFTYIF